MSTFLQIEFSNLACVFSKCNYIHSSNFVKKWPLLNELEHEWIIFPSPLKFPSPVSTFILFFGSWSPMKLNLKGTPQCPPPTSNPWNGSSPKCRQTKTRMNQKYNLSSPRRDRLFSGLASTGGSTDYIDQRGGGGFLSWTSLAPIIFPFKIKWNWKKKQEMKIQDAHFPW